MSNADLRKNSSDRRGCPICGACTDGSLCVRHRKALEKVAKHLSVWRQRLGPNLKWEEYLQRVSVNDQSGAWIREMAAYALEAGLKEPRDPNA